MPKSKGQRNAKIKIRKKNTPKTINKSQYEFEHYLSDDFDI